MSYVWLVSFFKLQDPVMSRLLKFMANLRIQKTGANVAVEVGVNSPGSDLGRWKANVSSTSRCIT